MKNERNYGVELLRIIAMFLVCVLHVLRFGGIMDNVAPLSSQYQAVWLLETAAYCAVNCYGLISGYVGVNSRFRLSRLIRLWLQVAFYCFGFYVVQVLFGSQKVPLSAVLKSLLPVTTNFYWYFTSYFCAFFFFPAINWLVNNMPRQKQRLCIYASLFLFCGISAFRGLELFGIEAGYSPLWLMALYFFGCYIRKFDCLSHWSVRRALLIYLGCVLAGWLWRWGSETFSVLDNGLLCRYISPNILLAAVALLAACLKLQAKPALRKVLAVAAPLSFGVYLIHQHPVVLRVILTDRYSFLADRHFSLILLGALAGAALTFCGCAALDWLRLKLFGLLRIGKLSDMLGEGIEKTVRKLRFSEKTHQ